MKKLLLGYLVGLMLLMSACGDDNGKPANTQKTGTESSDTEKTDTDKKETEKTDTDKKDTGDKDTGDKDTGDKDTGDKDTGDKDTDTGDKDTGEPVINPDMANKGACFYDNKEETEDLCADGLTETDCAKRGEDADWIEGTCADEGFTTECDDGMYFVEDGVTCPGPVGICVVFDEDLLIDTCFDGIEEVDCTEEDGTWEAGLCKDIDYTQDCGEYSVEDGLECEPSTVGACILFDEDFGDELCVDGVELSECYESEGDDWLEGSCFENGFTKSCDAYEVEEGVDCLDEEGEIGACIVADEMLGYFCMDEKSATDCAEEEGEFSELSCYDEGFTVECIEDDELYSLEEGGVCLNEMETEVMSCVIYDESVDDEVCYEGGDEDLCTQFANSSWSDGTCADNGIEVVCDDNMYAEADEACVSDVLDGTCYINNSDSTDVCVEVSSVGECVLAAEELVEEMSWDLSVTWYNDGDFCSDLGLTVSCDDEVYVEDGFTCEAL